MKLLYTQSYKIMLFTLTSVTCLLGKHSCLQHITSKPYVIV